MNLPQHQCVMPLSDGPASGGTAHVRPPPRPPQTSAHLLLEVRPEALQLRRVWQQLPPVLHAVVCAFAWAMHQQRSASTLTLHGLLDAGHASAAQHIVTPWPYSCCCSTLPLAWHPPGLPSASAPRGGHTTAAASGPPRPLQMCPARLQPPWRLTARRGPSTLLPPAGAEAAGQVGALGGWGAAGVAPPRGRPPLLRADRGTENHRSTLHNSHPYPTPSI